MTVFTLERQMEAAATAFYKEKRLVEEALGSRPTTKLEELRAEFNRIADQHFEAWQKAGYMHSYPYYVI